MNNHNHECSVSCGCYHPAVNLFLDLTKIDQPIKTIPKPTNDNSPPIRIFYNGKIYPFETGGIESPKSYDKCCEAMAIKLDEHNSTYKITYKILCLGSLDSVLREVGRKEVDDNDVNLELKTILPGLIEPHCHIVPTSILEFTTNTAGTKAWVSCSPIDENQCLVPDYTRESVFTYLSKQVEELTEEQVKDEFWLLAYDVDPSLMGDVYPGKDDNINILNCIDKESLDMQVSKCIPILLLNANLHTAYLNTPALNLYWDYCSDNDGYTFLIEKNNVKVDKDTWVEESNGLLNELTEMAPAVNAVNPAQIAAMSESVTSGIERYIKSARAKGITMLYDAGMMKEWAEMWFSENNINNDNRGIRIGMSFPYSIDKGKEEADKLLNCFFEEQKNVDTGEDKFVKPTIKGLDAYWGSVKIISDGSNQALTGRQTHDYACPPLGTNGIDNFTEQAKLSVGKATEEESTIEGNHNRTSLIEEILLKQWPMLIHANGNDSVTKTIEAYASARPNAKLTYKDFSKLRNRIEHCSLLNNDNGEYGMMSDLGILPSFLIGHVGYWGNVFKNYIFPSTSVDNNYLHLDLCNTLQNSPQIGLRISLHSDNSVSPLGPLRCAEQAITRIMEGTEEAKEYYKKWVNSESESKPTEEEFEKVTVNSVLNSEECLETYNALRAVTIDAAYHCHADHLVGSLLPGKLADFVVLENDPMEMNTSYTAYLNMRSINVLETWVGGIKYVQEIAEVQ
jgi:predicted amidohydrolase YtcJ